MGYLLALLSLALIGVLTAAVLRWAGVAKKSAMWAGVAAVVATAALVAAAGLVSLGECLGDNGSPPSAWHWSPRIEFCDEGFPEPFSWLVLFLVPSGLVIVGTLLRSRGHTWLALVPYAALLPLPALPFLYLDSLDYYRLGSYPVLDQPLLKPARAGTPSRVCYVYGIVTGPRKVLVTPETKVNRCIAEGRAALRAGGG